MEHPRDARAHNPRLQCDVCGIWSRLHRKDGQQFMFGGCEMNHGNDHTGAGKSQDVCYKCCPVTCRPKESR